MLPDIGVSVAMNHAEDANHSGVNLVIHTVGKTLQQYAANRAANGGIPLGICFDRANGVLDLIDKAPARDR